MLDNPCDNCGAKRHKPSDTCDKCGYVPQRRVYDTPISLVFCATCGNVYVGACSKGHETTPYKPKR